MMIMLKLITSFLEQLKNYVDLCKILMDIPLVLENVASFGPYDQIM